MESNRIINRDYIGFIKKEDNFLKYDEFEITTPRELIDTIKKMGEDDNNTIMDIQNFFSEHFFQGNSKKTTYNHMYPNAYTSIFNVGASSPVFYNAKEYPFDKIEIGGIFSSCIYDGEYKIRPCGFISKDEYSNAIEKKEKLFYEQNLKIVLDKLKNEIGDNEEKRELEKFERKHFNYNIGIKSLRERFYEEVNKKTNKDITELIKNLRLSFSKGVIRYLYAKSYESAKKGIQNTAVMFSLENIGWTTIKYEITPDERIELQSNFGYGISSYFYLRLFYKGISISPYSDAIKYSYVSWTQIIKHIRKYEPNRETCWNNAFKFIIYVSNLIIRNPQKFIDEFIVEEIKTMITDLKYILNSENEKIINYYGIHNIENRRTISVFNTDLEKEYDVFPNELCDSIKIEKASGCLYFLEDLKKLTKFFPIIHQYITDLLDINSQIEPIIDKYLTKLPEEITQKENELAGIKERKILKEKEIENIENEYNTKGIELYDVKLETIENNPQLISDYKKYKLLKTNLDNLNDQYFEIESKLDLLKNFLDKFKECKKRISSLIDTYQ